MTFARDPATRAYYERRAHEYDEWYEGVGVFAGRERPGWGEEVSRVVALLAALPPARTLDVACGTGFLTRHLPGDVEAVDQSPRMAEIARSRGIAARVGDASRLVGDYERLFTSHFYGHLLPGQRMDFLAQARAVASELIVCDSAGDDEQWQERTLNDGTRHRVWKRWFRGAALAEELGGGEVLHEGRWFVVVSTLAGR